MDLNKLIDLSHSIDEGMPVYPGTPLPKIKQACTHSSDGFAELSLQISSHTGTHIDAPYHIFENGQTLADFSIQQFYGKGITIPIIQNNADLTGLIKEKINEFGKPDFVLFNTKWSTKWGTPSYFESFPTPNQATISFLCKLGLKGIGIDAISIDNVNDENLPNHRKFLAQNMVIIENLTNLDQLLNSSFDFFCFPLKIRNGDGSPVRAVALNNS